MARRLLLWVLIALIAAGAAPAALASSGEWQAAEFTNSAHAGPGKHPTEESDRFKLLSKKPFWFVGGTVEYRTLDAPSAAAVAAVDAAIATIDGYVTTRSFARNDATGQTNPCTGQPNTVRWAPIDGPGGTLAVALVCFNKFTDEIGGFEVVFDSGDGWSIGPDEDPTTFDVQNVATHEMGHAAGLDHVKAPKDGCLTMYPFSGPEETQKRTLGLGDKLGLDELYSHGDRSPGPGCGA